MRTNEISDGVALEAWPVEPGRRPKLHLAIARKGGRSTVSLGVAGHAAPRWQFLGVLMIAALLLAGPTSAVAADLNAKAALPRAVAAAKKWRPDATLTHVSSITVNADGSAKSWLYTFYAPQSKKSLIVTATGTTLDMLEVPNTSMQPIGQVLIDSNQAMQEAKKHDLKGSNPTMGLVVMGFTGAPVWSVNGGFAEGDVSVILDGKTGKFFRRQVISYK